MNKTPRHSLAALVFIHEDGKILLLRQTYGARYWALPGGLVEIGESVEQAAIREVKEETGLDVRLVRLVGVYSKVASGELVITFEGAVTGGDFRPDSAEIDGYGYYALEDLPSPTWEHLPDRLADFLHCYPYAVFRSQ